MMALSCTRIIHFSNVARDFGLTVGEDRDGHVACTHAKGSLHYQACAPGRATRRAFDAFAPMNTIGKLKMARFARHMRRHHRGELKEFIYNGRFTKVSIKNGLNVPPSFWGTVTWNNHQNHCHCGV